MERLLRLLMVICGMVILLHSSNSLAGNGPFMVVYNHNPKPKGEKEMMMMMDYVNAKVGNENIAHMLELGYGVTDRLTTDLMLEGQKTFGDIWLYTGWRWEARYRLFEQELPINPMIYVEWENLNGATKYKMEVSGYRNLEPIRSGKAKIEKEKILETRLILGKTFGQTTVSFNWINESDTRNDWETAFGYAAGISHKLNPPLEDEGRHHHTGVTNKTQWIVGVELYGGVGDIKSFRLKPELQEHYVSPAVQIMPYVLGEMLHIHLSPVIGLTDASDKFLFRTAIGFEF